MCRLRYCQVISAGPHDGWCNRPASFGRHTPAHDARNVDTVDTSERVTIEIEPDVDQSLPACRPIGAPRAWRNARPWCRLSGIHPSTCTLRRVRTRLLPEGGCCPPHGPLPADVNPHPRGALSPHPDENRSEWHLIEPIGSDEIQSGSGRDTPYYQRPCRVEGTNVMDAWATVHAERWFSAAHGGEANTVTGVWPKRANTHCRWNAGGDPVI